MPRFHVHKILSAFVRVHTEPFLQPLWVEFFDGHSSYFIPFRSILRSIFADSTTPADNRCKSLILQPLTTMGFKISIEPSMITEVETYDLTFRYYPYTVYADDQRILCINTTSSQTLSKWLTNVLRSTPKNTPVIVGVTAEHQFTKYTKRGVKDQGYDFISLCVGSHCLLYPLPGQADSYKAKQNPRPLCDFFANPRVIAVGMEIEKVKGKLEKHHGIELKKALDLRAMAEEGMKEVGEKVDLWRYNLDKLAKTVLGKHFDVERPEEKLDWYDEEETLCCYYNVYTDEKTMFITIDSYLCYLIGSKLHGMIHGHKADKSQDSCKSKKKKVNKKKNLRGAFNF